MRDISIERIMTRDPATISPQSSAAEARRMLDSNVINHLPDDTPKACLLNAIAQVDKSVDYRNARTGQLLHMKAEID